MVFPGLKKLGKELEFKNNGTFTYGFIGNTYVVFADGPNQKNLWFRFSVCPDEETKQKINEWKKKGYAKEIQFFDNDSFDVKFTFAEYIRPFKISKIKEVILDITDYVNKKSPGEKVKCTGENCSVTENLEVYNVANVPLPMCHNCAQKLQNQIDNTYQEMDSEPDNYIKGTVFAFIFSLPAILLTFLIMFLGRIAGISGVITFFLAQKGYLFGKGKYNRVGVVIISVLSFLLTIAGTYLSYVGLLVKNLLSYPETKDFPLGTLVKQAFEITQIPEVRNELFVNLKLSAFLCGICIVTAMVQAFKQTGKVKIQKTDLK